MYTENKLKYYNLEEGKEDIGTLRGHFQKSQWSTLCVLMGTVGFTAKVHVEGPRHTALVIYATPSRVEALDKIPRGGTHVQ